MSIYRHVYICIYLFVYVFVYINIIHKYIDIRGVIDERVKTGSGNKGDITSNPIKVTLIKVLKTDRKNTMNSY